MCNLKPHIFQFWKYSLRKFVKKSSWILHPEHIKTYLNKHILSECSQVYRFDSNLQGFHETPGSAILFNQDYAPPDGISILTTGSICFFSPPKKTVLEEDMARSRPYILILNLTLYIHLPFGISKPSMLTFRYCDWSHPTTEKTLRDADPKGINPEETPVTTGQPPGCYEESPREKKGLRVRSLRVWVS